MSLFTDAFAGSMEEWERVAGEPFILNAVSYAAQSVEEITVEIRAMLGGRFQDAQTRILLSAAVIAASGIAKGAIITVRGERMRVTPGKPENDGTGSFWLGLGSTQIEPPEL